MDMIVSYNDEDETWNHDRDDEHDRYDWYDAVAPVSTRITDQYIKDTTHV
jgi:hypothetical protein